MLFSKKEKQLLAVMDGRAVALDKVPDEAFASGILGVGLAIEPTAGTVYAPISGKIESITDSKHAYSILSDDGLDLLVHIGIDTVTLGGEGFLPMVQKGDHVNAGDVLARVDLDLLRARGLATVTPVIITSPDLLSKKEIFLGDTVGGKTVIMRYRIE